jgi:SagB-type dehydrogenase family enzyme
LDVFTRPRTVRSALDKLGAKGNATVSKTIQELRELGFLARARPGAAGDIAAAWRGCFPAAYYHFASRDVVYATEPLAKMSAAASRFAVSASPSLFKDYSDLRFTRLPTNFGRYARMSLGRSLRKRRTIREFADRSVLFSVFASLIRNTFGMMGVVDGGVFGRLLAKTSPSAGARHPIEAYVIAWKVRGLKPGLYHYSVRRNLLEELRQGDLRQEAVRAAAGQRWIGDAAFVVVLTAVADRVFWKYSTPESYRLFLLDAGHLAQTFCLLAAAAGLGPFTTAAIQESLIEKLLGIDGVREFPVYLCGAGMPSHSPTGRSTEGLR